MLSDPLLISIILAIATAIQSVVGFGLALFAVPMMLMVGLPLLPSVFLVMVIALLNALLALSRLKLHFDAKRSAVAAVFRAVGIVPGYALAVYTLKSSPAHLKAAIGFAIGLGVVAQVLKLKTQKPSSESQTVSPSARLAPWAFLLSGVLAGWLGMGGPPLVFWLLTGTEDPKRSRAFLYGVYAFTIPFQLALMTYDSPDTALIALPILTLACPLCLITSLLALQKGDKLKVEGLQWLSLAVLSLLSLKALLDWVLVIS